MTMIWPTVNYWLCLSCLCLVLCYIWWLVMTRPRREFGSRHLQSPDLPILIFITAGRWWLTATLHPTCPKLCWPICHCVVLSLVTFTLTLASDWLMGGLMSPLGSMSPGQGVIWPQSHKYQLCNVRELYFRQIYNALHSTQRWSLYLGTPGIFVTICTWWQPRGHKMFPGLGAACHSQMYHR